MDYRSAIATINAHIMMAMITTIIVTGLQLTTSEIRLELFGLKYTAYAKRSINISV